MTIKQGGVFGRNPTFNTVTTQGSVTIAGPLTVNAASVDVDTQIGTLTGPYSFWINGANGAVGFGTNSVTPYFGTTAQLYGTSGGTLQVAGPSITAGLWAAQGLGYAQLETVTAHDLRIATNSTERVRIGATSGNVTISNGNLVIGTSGKGIDFSATAGTGTSELFSDYEEGTWSPSVTSGVGTITTVTAVGNYTKIGRNVIADIKITITDNGTGAGFLKTTLPFVPTNISSCGFGRENNVTGVGVSFQAEASVNNANLVTVTNTYPGGTGYVITATLTYFV